MSNRRGVTKDEAEGTRYVHVQDPSSGWPAMVKTVREADVEKIADCKEDIDTLLVFAGLYSAVLSAFIIESYKTLRQDNQDVMVDLMRQFVAKNFTSGPGFINSTTPVPEIPDFEPPLWAIRVNVLWFISLILSLSAASFGMLVKQWLREYLALEYTTPQQRLRARQYRSPALSKWKVFEIAAFLPVLLQISLGLFFIGLCFFTSAVNNSVRNCTVPVVCAWAVLLLITTIAPIFSPRCPFKTTFLKTTLKVCRRYIAPAFRHSGPFIAQGLFYAFNYVSVGRKFKGALRIAYCVIAAVLNCAHLLLRRSYGALREVWDLTLGHWWETKGGFRYDPRNITEALAEEEDLVKREQEDAEILSSVDALMSDDGLLPVMVETVQQQTDPMNIVAFVLQILSRRLGQDLPAQGLTQILQLNALSKRVWFVTTDAIAATLLRHNPRPLAPDSPPWVYDAVILLLSHSPYSLSQLAVRALRDSIARDGARCVELGKRLVNTTTARTTFASLSQRLLQLREVHDEKVWPDPIMDIYAGLLCRGHHHASLLLLLHEHGPEELLSSSADILDDLFDVIIPLGRWVATVMHSAAHGGLQLVQIMMQHGEALGKLNGASELCTQMMLDMNCVYWVTSHFAALHRNTRAGAEQEHVFLNAYLSSKPHDQDHMVFHMTTLLHHYCHGSYDSHTNWPLLDIIRLCRLQLKIYFSAVYHNARQWSALWLQLARALTRYHEISGWEGKPTSAYWLPEFATSTADEILRDDEDFACECLSIIIAHPESYTPANPQVEGRILVAALWLFATQETKQRFEQLRQICHLPTGNTSELIQESGVSDKAPCEENGVEAEVVGKDDTNSSAAPTNLIGKNKDAETIEMRSSTAS